MLVVWPVSLRVGGNAMGKTVKGIYAHGEIRLLEDLQITGKQEVHIVFPDDTKPRVRGIPASAFQEIDGICAGGQCFGGD
jgi:hypothetical protein